ncbi:MAG TPA: IS1595 family transposase [Steroidobacteraceae bacterium]|jgi:transposase-like protein|nr:IS1595 family transposase [Steroidobacteraceae bacterium]
MIKQFKTLADLCNTFSDNQVAIDHFRAIRWKNGEFCPHCGHDKIYTPKDKAGRYTCAQCHQRFSILVGTIFENTKLPLRVWFGAIWLLTNHPKGIASTTLARDLGITQKSAWFVLHRLRYAARTQSFNAPLTGKVEVDETYVGGKAHNKRGGRGGSGGGVKGKTAVIGAVSDKGGVIAKVLPRTVGWPEAQKFIDESVSRDADMLVTDAHQAYKGLQGYPQHEIVNHYRGEYARGKVHTNTIESVWAMLKRQINGTHHWVSARHLQKYVDEMAWRMSRRAMTAEERINALFSAVEGRLTYKALIA